MVREQFQRKEANGFQAGVMVFMSTFGGSVSFYGSIRFTHPSPSALLSPAPAFKITDAKLNVA